MKRDSDLRLRFAPPALMVASGFAALGYQMVWTQQCASWLGHESAAVLAVVAAFFGGLALGGLLLGSRIERSTRPVRWYAGCELLVAAWSLLLVVVLSPASALLLEAIGSAPGRWRHWTVAFGGTLLLFLPATMAMGATLPAVERLAAAMRREGRTIAALYAANTIGAVLGVVVTAFWLIPAIGLARSAAVCIALSALSGVTAFAVFPQRVEIAPPPAPDRPRARGALLRLVITGLLGIGYEVLVVRVLSQVTEDTVYTFALLLAVYLAGTAAGAAGYQHWRAARRDRDDAGDALFGAVAAACLVSGASLWGAELLKAYALRAFGAGVTSALAAEAVLAFAAFAPPTIAMGALFSHLCDGASAAGVSYGRALGVNMLAAASAPVLAGVLAVPAMGAKIALLVLVAGYLASTTRRSLRKPVIWVPATGALCLGLFAPPLTFVEVPDGSHVVRYEEGVMAVVSVVENADGVARLRINNRQQEGSSGTLRVDARQAWLPLLLHPAPHRALFLGLGTGVTASSAAEDPTLNVDAVELLPEVVAASPRFTRRFGEGAASRLHLITADARRFVRVSDRRYDVIVSDNFHPARSGSSALYTVEHFEAVRRRLDDHGVFCQWLPLHQLDVDTLRSIVRSFVTVFPGGWAMIASNSLETPVLGLFARADACRFDVEALRQRRSHSALPDRVSELGLDDELAVLGSVVAGPEALARLGANAVANTDDRPVVAYRAPRITYAPDSSPRDRLIALLHELSIAPEQLISAAPDSTWPRRLAAYWIARDRFIESGRDVRPSPNVQQMLAQVREPLLSVLRISPDFRPAYDPLLSMAAALAGSDLAGARRLLTELTQIQPARAEAPRLLAQMGTSPSAAGVADVAGAVPR